MAKTLRDILADAAAAPNETTFELAGEKFTLAEFRGLHSEDQRALAQKVADAERIGKEAQGLLTGLEAAMAEAAKRGEKKEDAPAKPSDWRKNPLYDELVPVIEGLEATVKSATESAAAMKKSLDFSQAVYGLERMRRQWAESKVKPTGKTFEQAVTEVLAAKEVDEVGLPTLDRYLYRATEPDRIKVASDEAVAKARTEWDKQHKLDAVPKPGARFTSRGKGEKPPIANLSELTPEMIAADPDIPSFEGPVQ
jgi:hypothetical protein